MDDDEAGVRQLIGLGGGEPRCSEYTGTKALMMAVLEGGIRDYCGAAGRRQTEAEYWVRSNRRGTFSFAVVCETLGLDPSRRSPGIGAIETSIVTPVRSHPSKFEKASTDGTLAVSLHVGRPYERAVERSCCDGAAADL